MEPGVEVEAIVPLLSSVLQFVTCVTSFTRAARAAIETFELTDPIISLNPQKRHTKRLTFHFILC